jgi:legumain
VECNNSNGRVLESTEEDNVLINFIDHGAPGMVAFPSTVMYAKDLIRVLTQMHTRKMYKQMVFYLEACESGSMFVDLPTDMNIFATTAANAKESSWGTCK